MSTDDFGVYSFVISSLGLLSLVFEFGLFFPAARIAANETRTEQRSTIGAALALFTPIAALYAVAVVALAPLTDRSFAVHAGSVLLAAAPVAFVVPFRLVAQWLAQGTGRLTSFSIASSSASILLVAALLAWSRWATLTPTAAVLIQMSTALVAWIWFIVRLRPRFDALEVHVRRLADHARQYGARIYVGRVLSVGTYRMDVVMLAALGTAPSVGYYVLAGAIADGACLPVQAFGAAAFDRLARRPTIPTTYVTGSWLAAATLAAVAAVLAEPFVSLVYSERYLSVAPLVLPLALAAALRAVTNIYNTFLAGHGEGRALTNASAALTVSNLVLNLVLIPPFGAPGAAWASFGALAVNYAAHVIGYRRMLAATAPV